MNGDRDARARMRRALDGVAASQVDLANALRRLEGVLDHLTTSAEEPNDRR